MSKDTAELERAIVLSEDALECAEAIQRTALDKVYGIHHRAKHEEGSALITEYACKYELADYLAMMQGVRLLIESALGSLREVSADF